MQDLEMHRRSSESSEPQIPHPREDFDESPLHFRGVRLQGRKLTPAVAQRADYRRYRHRRFFLALSPIYIRKIWGDLYRSKKGTGKDEVEKPRDTKTVRHCPIIVPMCCDIRGLQAKADIGEE